MGKLNQTHKTLAIAAVLAFSLLSLIAIVKADITIPAGTAISIDSGRYLTLGKDMTFATPVTYGNGFTDGRGFWINSTCDLTLSCWFEDNWINYTVTSLGTQQICNGSKPLYVLIDGWQATETNGWTYAGGIVTVTAAIYNVRISFASVSTPPGGPGGTSGWTGSYQLIWVVTLSGKMVDGANIKLVDAAYGWYVAELFTLDGQASQSLASGTYNYTVTYKTYEVKGTLIHDSDETVSVDLATKKVTVSWPLGERIKVALIVLTFFAGGLLVYGRVKKRR